ncbi:hypothetical protein Tco_0224795, partial [Tanacetum coccineum]
VEAAENILPVAAHEEAETIHNMTTENKLYFQAEKFVTVVKQRQEIDTVSYHKLFDVLKQFQNEVYDICSERLARSANPLALLAKFSKPSVLGKPTPFSNSPEMRSFQTN